MLLSHFSRVRQPTRLPHPWDSPGKNTGEGCHFLLQCIRVKSEREVAQSCPTLCDPMNHSTPGLPDAAKSLQLCPTLCDPIDDSPTGSPIPGILHARTLEWVAISFSNAWKWKVKSESKFTQSCPILSDPMDCSLPGSSVHGIFQARVLEWGAIAFSDSFIYP